MSGHAQCRRFRCELASIVAFLVAIDGIADIGNSWVHGLGQHERWRRNWSLPQRLSSHRLPIVSARLRTLPPVAGQPCRRFRSRRRDHLVEQLTDEADGVDERW